MATMLYLRACDAFGEHISSSLRKQPKGGNSIFLFSYVIYILVLFTLSVKKVVCCRTKKKVEISYRQGNQKKKKI